MSKAVATVQTLAVPFDLSRGQDEDFCRRLEALVDQGSRLLHLDCTALELVHSSHIGLLWKARSICFQKSTEILLENTSDSLIRTIQALDLSETFGIGLAPGLRWKAAAAKSAPSVDRQPQIGSFSADAAGVDAGLREFLELIDKWQLDEVVKFDLRTLFYEVANNIACHSGLAEDARIQYRAVCTDNELRLVFEDNGKPFDPLSLPDEFDPKVAAQRHQTRGFGISLIRRLADSIDYSFRDDTTNVLSLVKRHGDG